mgnify:CR=1 FL=1
MYPEQERSHPRRDGEGTRVRTDSFVASDTVISQILGESPFPVVIEVLHVEPDDVQASLDTFRRSPDQDLSFTDASSVHLCESRGIDAVSSFDGDSDGLVARTEPGRSTGPALVLTIRRYRPEH